MRKEREKRKEKERRREYNISDNVSNTLLLCNCCQAVNRFSVVLHRIACQWHSFCTACIMKIHYHTLYTLSTLS